MTKYFFFVFFFIGFLAKGASVSGTIRSAKDGKALPFSSILIKGSTKGVSANSNGFYTLSVSSGSYTLVCQFIGYTTEEKKITVGKDNIVIDFELNAREYDLKDVVVKSGAEDPAYAIIRKAIEKRAEHLTEIKEFSTEVYIKGQMQLRSFPKKFFGEKVDFEDGDTSKRKMLFLSETIAKYSVEVPNKKKIEVLSTKVSGRSDGFGFSNPQIISFYENTISMGRSLNPRGFVSPLSDNALNYYRYKFEGTFYEFGKEVSRIKVIPKRMYEPLFTGYINITENDWRIQSIDLMLLKQQQMQLLDTLVIQQQYVPAGDIWVIKNQVIYPSGKFFGFDFFGSFLQVYDKFNLTPAFKPKFFNNTILKYYDSSNKKTSAYWDSIRPLPLSLEEIKDYKKKDSLELVRKDPRYLDSLDRIRNKFSLKGFLLTGQTISKQKYKTTISFQPLLTSLQYNTVEGGVMQFSSTVRKEFEGRRSISITPSLRYGFANKHFNPSMVVNYIFGKKYIQNVSFSGGRKVYQFNNSEPISERINTLYTLQSEYNYLKIYEANYFSLGYAKGIGNGVNILGNFQFQDRMPLENLADMTVWKSYPNRQFTPNYPTELTGINMVRNQAATVTLGITWRPGAKYIEYPDRKVNIGSRQPTFTASITQGINGLLGSDVDFTRWKIGVSDELNLKLAGRFNYNIVVGGFLQAAKTFIPDYQHYLGNQTILSAAALNSFQLATYYRYSNTASFNATSHIEYHLNGLISNKIPGFRKLNWFFVTGANGLHIKNGTDYAEYFIGLENIFKIIRVDFVQGFEKAGAKPTGFRVSIPLIR